MRSLEATALLARILEVLTTPLFAFDRENLLQLVNNAGVKLLGLPHARCFGHSARELGLEELLAAPDQTIHSFGAKSTRWLLRKAAFRQDGAPHTLLLLSDVSLPLQEEEQTGLEAADPGSRPRAFQLAGSHQIHRRQPVVAGGPDEWR